MQGGFCGEFSEGGVLRKALSAKSEHEETSCSAIRDAEGGGAEPQWDAVMAFDPILVIRRVLELRKAKGECHRLGFGDLLCSKLSVLPVFDDREKFIDWLENEIYTEENYTKTRGIADGGVG